MKITPFKSPDHKNLRKGAQLPANKRIIPQNSRNAEIKENTEIAVKQDVTPEIINKHLISKSSSLVKENKPLKSRNTPVLRICDPLPSNLHKSRKKIIPSKLTINEAVNSIEKIIPDKAITSDWDIKPEPMTIKSILEEGSISSSTEILRHYYLTLIENKISVKAVELSNIKGPTITDIFSTIREVCPKYLAYITEHKHHIKDQVNNLQDILILDPEFMQQSAEEIRGEFLRG